MEGAVIKSITVNRPALRYPFPANFQARLQEQKLVRLKRRAKFLNACLSSGERLLMHLGMSGRFTVAGSRAVGNFAQGHGGDPKHDHVIFHMDNGATVTFNDMRRFGFMELIAPGEPSRLDILGPEPLDPHFNAEVLRAALQRKKTTIKSALLDQHVIAGLGNIYVCEALYRAGIFPGCLAASLSGDQTEALTDRIRVVLREAIGAGGASLRDFANTEGLPGYFQHSFDVYDREGQPCKNCDTLIERFRQAGRSTFYCPSCQQEQGRNSTLAIPRPNPLTSRPDGKGFYVQ